MKTNNVCTVIFSNIKILALVQCQSLRPLIFLWE